MSEKLKPCPFCGGEADIRKPATSFGLTRIKCNGCGAFAAFQGRRTRGIPAEYWNRRDGDRKD